MVWPIIVNIVKPALQDKQNSADIATFDIHVLFPYLRLLMVIWDEGYRNLCQAILKACNYKGLWGAVCKKAKKRQPTNIAELPTRDKRESFAEIAHDVKYVIDGPEFSWHQAKFASYFEDLFCFSANLIGITQENTSKSVRTKKKHFTFTTKNKNAASVLENFVSQPQFCAVVAFAKNLLNFIGSVEDAQNWGSQNWSSANSMVKLLDAKTADNDALNAQTETEPDANDDAFDADADGKDDNATKIQTNPDANDDAIKMARMTTPQRYRPNASDGSTARIDLT